MHMELKSLFTFLFMSKLFLFTFKLFLFIFNSFLFKLFSLILFTFKLFLFKFLNLFLLMFELFHFTFLNLFLFTLSVPFHFHWFIPFHIWVFPSHVPQLLSFCMLFSFYVIFMLLQFPFQFSLLVQYLISTLSIVEQLYVIHFVHTVFPLFSEFKLFKLQVLFIYLFNVSGEVIVEWPFNQQHVLLRELVYI